MTKVLSTGMGEVTSDYLVHRLDPVVAVALGGLGLMLALGVQFWVRRYLAWAYWLAVVMVAVAGTMAADVLHVGLGVPYAVSSTLFSVALAVCFAAWYASERTLSIHSIHSLRREAFYWATVMATFALGTAAGDMAATTFHLGYLLAGVAFAGLIAIPAAAHRFLNANPILTFWVAYVLTRPLGASLADWLGLPPARGGLGLGTGLISVVLTILIVVLVGYLTVTHEDVEVQGAAV
ncbi:MAG: COG4705 family protein [Candidatus Dormibacteria bacterium]